MQHSTYYLAKGKRMKIGSDKFKEFWLKYRKKRYTFIYTSTGFGWFKKDDKKPVGAIECDIDCSYNVRNIKVNDVKIS